MARRSARTCEACGRHIRSNNTRAVFLFWRPNEVKAEVCNQRCLARYNEGEDVIPGGEMSEVQTYKVGDHLPDGREVTEVDADGRPLVVGPKPKGAKPASGAVEVARATHDTSVSESIAADTAHLRKRPSKAPKSEPGPAALTEVLNAPLKKAAKKGKPASKKAINTAAIAEKVAAAKAPAAPVAATETKEEDVPKAKAKKAPKKGKTAKASTGRKTKWTEDLKTKLRGQLKAGTTTYAAIAKEMGVTPQTVWASLNRKK